MEQKFLVESWSEKLEATYVWVKFSKIDKALLQSYHDELKEMEEEGTNKGGVSINDFTPSFLDWMLLIHSISFNV